MKLLVLATEAISESDVREIVEANEGEGTEVLVLAPTIVESSLKYWVSDVDAARVSAAETANELAKDFEEAGATVHEHIGDVDPRVAIEDAMRIFEPDRVLVVKHPSADEAYREDQLTDHVVDTVDIPVEVRNIPRGES